MARKSESNEAEAAPAPQQLEQTPTDAAPAQPEAAPDVPAEIKPDQAPRYVVAPGRTLKLSGRGAVGPGDEVHAIDVAGGQEALDAFVASGFLQKV